MRSIACALLLSLLPSFVAAAASGPALEVFKSGVYKSAIPLLQRQCSTDKDNVTLRAALLSALVYEGKVDQAADLSQDLAQGFPGSPEALAPRGEFHYYIGEMAGAEKLCKAAIKVKEATARALRTVSNL